MVEHQLVFFYFGAGKKGSGTLPIETAVLASTLVGVSVECDFLDVLNAIDCEWRTPYNQTAASFYLDLQLAASRSVVFNTSKKSHSTLTPTRVEASTAVSMGSVSDPFFPPQYKRKKRSGYARLGLTQITL